LVVRTAGTEPLVRLMAEGYDQKKITQLVDELAATLQSRRLAG
jgi:phosphomannomutase